MIYLRLKFINVDSFTYMYVVEVIFGQVDGKLYLTSSDGALFSVVCFLQI